ncbi:MAG: NAD(P)H-hydrate dehydratase [Coriobacteriales bacterium]|jgi:hydroxyethylthiazole kinase-like uncharacterized protein yjeF|nr:NAD(P)H-hydrate dehydratase [Coriobacteriales bacterium]
MYRFPTLPPIADDANKYTRGALLILAGSYGYPGAAILCARASARSGAGYTLLGMPAEAAPFGKNQLQSIPVLAMGDGDFFDEQDLKKIEPLLGRYNAVVCGPGIGVQKSTHRFVEQLLESIPSPLLLDADALNCIDNKRMVKALQQRLAPTILTPHGGELLRLYQNVEVNTPKALAQVTGSVVVAKGPDTVICDSQTTIKVSNGTAALAKAGTGDVLAGVIGGLLAQGMVPFDAAVAGVYLHAEAGVKAEAKIGRRSVVAGDVTKFLVSAIKDLEK